MPFVNVRFHTLNTTTGAPVGGVYVRLFDRYGVALVTAYNSDDSGVIEAVLPTELAPYTARLFRVGWAWGPPVLLPIQEDGEWELRGEELHRPVSSDPRVCVAYGYFRDATNQPHKGLDMHFMPVFDPLLVDGNAVLKERTLLRTDADGYAEIPLIRCAKYDVVLEGVEERVRQILIPDTVNCNLPELIFAYVSRVEITPSPIELLVGDSLDLCIRVWASSGVPLGGPALRDVRWRVDQPSPPVVGMTILPDKIVLRGVTAGSAKLIPERVDKSIISIPYAPLTDQAVDITVTQ